MKNIIQVLRNITKRHPNEFVTAAEIKDLFVLFLHHFSDPVEISNAIDELDKEEIKHNKEVGCFISI